MGFLDKVRRARTEQKARQQQGGQLTRGDMRRFSRDLDSSLRKGQQPSGLQTTGRAVRMMGRGLGNIGRSLATPSTGQRPRISQMPARRKDMGIVGHIDLSAMKDPGLRKRDIRGRRSR